jgi:hypothetical protein
VANRRRGVGGGAGARERGKRRERVPAGWLSDGLKTSTAAQRVRVAGGGEGEQKM